MVDAGYCIKSSHDIKEQLLHEPKVMNGKLTAEVQSFSEVIPILCSDFCIQRNPEGMKLL